MPYIPGFQPEEPGPLSRFLPPLEEGTVAGWLAAHIPPSSWLLDPFGFAPRIAVEAARAGYRILVTVNNPVTHFLLELAAHPPAELDFTAGLAALASSRKNDEPLERHLRALYVTHCQQCGREIEAEAFLWKKDETAPFARLYTCPECGDKGERPATQDDVERARRIAEADALHRSRALQRVSTDPDDKPNIQEALQHYLPRPLYALTTLINRLDSLELNPERRRALTALVLAACDAGNSLWGHPAERPRPKQLYTPAVFRENNLWLMLERAGELWTDKGAPVACVSWPAKIPESSGICIYDGRLSSLAHELRREIPIAAVIGSVPRPNQAFWTLSALWAGWLWGRSAVEPFRIALRRRRYDWTWNATALHAAASHLSDLLALGTPFFGLLPEAEPAFLTSAATGIGAAGFDLKGLALRTEQDPVQLVWERGERLRRGPGEGEAADVRGVLEEYLEARGEPATYLHLLARGLEALTEQRALRQPEQEFDAALHAAQSAMQTALQQGPRFVHHTTGEAVEAGLWGLRDAADTDSLTDRAEIAIVNHLQKDPRSIYLEVEAEVYRRLPGLLTPSKGIIYAVLNSYAARDGATWMLRPEDTTARRQEDLKRIAAIIEAVGRRLKYAVRQEERLVLWEQDGLTVRVFVLMASALVRRAVAENPYPAAQSILVVPGGRASLIAYKAQRDPLLAEEVSHFRLAKYRLWRSLAEVPILTRETFEEQLSSDPIERAQGQMMMF